MLAQADLRGLCVLAIKRCLHLILQVAVVRLPYCKRMLHILGEMYRALETSGFSGWQTSYSLRMVDTWAA